MHNNKYQVELVESDPALNGPVAEDEEKGCCAPCVDDDLPGDGIPDIDKKDVVVWDKEFVALPSILPQITWECFYNVNRKFPQKKVEESDGSKVVPEKSLSSWKYPSQIVPRIFQVGGMYSPSSPQIVAKKSKKKSPSRPKDVVIPD